MNNKIIVSGCSYSNVNEYSQFLEKKEYVINISANGQSNDIIIKKIYDYINEKKCKDCLFICQLTYLHRIGFYHSVFKRWLSYQPMSINDIPFIDDKTNKVKPFYTFINTMMNDKSLNKFTPFYSELNKMYQTYLKYVFDEDIEFFNLMYQIDLLKSFVKETENEVIFLYWPEIENENHLKELQKRNFFHIKKNYSMLNWTIHNKVHGVDSHLSKDGAKIFSNFIKQHKLLKKFKKTFKKTII
jgi:hypothetical protein